jgi:hypothetical protein
MTTRWETSVNADGEWDVCEEGGGDMIADLKSNPNGERDANQIARDHNEAQGLRDCLAMLEEITKRQSKETTGLSRVDWKALNNTIQAALRGTTEKGEVT